MVLSYVKMTSILVVINFIICASVYGAPLDYKTNNQFGEKLLIAKAENNTEKEDEIIVTQDFVLKPIGRKNGKETSFFWGGLITTILCGSLASWAFRENTDTGKVLGSLSGLMAIGGVSLMFGGGGTSRQLYYKTEKSNPKVKE